MQERHRFYPTAWSSVDSHPVRVCWAAWDLRTLPVGEKGGRPQFPACPAAKSPWLHPHPPGDPDRWSLWAATSPPLPPTTLCLSFSARVSFHSTWQRSRWERHFRCMDSEHVGVMGTAPFSQRYSSSVSETNKRSGQRSRKGDAWQKHRCVIKIWGNSYLTSNYRNATWNIAFTSNLSKDLSENTRCINMHYWWECKSCRFLKKLCAL